MIKKILYFIKTKDGNVVFYNFLSLSILQAASILLPLITLPYILRTIEIEKYGLIAFSASLIIYFQSIVDYSFKITATRDISRHRHNKLKLNLIYSKVMTIKFLFLIISYVIVSLCVYCYTPFNKEKILIFYSFLSLVGHFLFPDWFFQGIEKMRYISTINISLKIIFTISVLYFINSPDDYTVYPLLQGASLILSGLIGQLILFRKYDIRYYKLKKNTLSLTIKNNFPTFLNQFLPTLYNNTSSFLIGIILGPYYLGVFDAINKIVSIFISFLNILSRISYPYLVRNSKHFKQYSKFMFLIAFSTLLLLVLSHNPIMWLLNINYNDSFLILTILSFGVLGLVTYDVFGLNYFLIRKKGKLVMKNTLIASLLGCIFSYPLISYYGIIGASLNLTISRFLMGFGLYIQYHLNKHVL